MKQIDEARLENDLEYRAGYLMEFMGFGEEDIAMIHASAPLVAPLVEGLVDAVYVKLHSYDATWRHFLPRQAGMEGDDSVPVTLEDLTLDHPHILYRKQHLGAYLRALVTRPYDQKMLLYLDMVGKIHTTKAGNAQINVPLVQMNALLGWVHDALNVTIMGLDLDDTTKTKAIRAFSKLLWIQSDLISRHYV